MRIDFILFKTQDFGKNPYMRRFVHDYIRVLYAHNDGPQAVCDFVRKYVISVFRRTTGHPTNLII